MIQPPEDRVSCDARRLLLLQSVEHAENRSSLLPILTNFYIPPIAFVVT
jgi:hypothetical protein